MKCPLLLLAICLAGCAPHASVKMLPPPREATTASSPLAALEQQVEAADRAWRQLNAKPADIPARLNHNSTVPASLALWIGRT